MTLSSSKLTITTQQETAGTAFQSAPFNWAAGNNLYYKVSGYGSITFGVTIGSVPSPFVAITANVGSIDTTNVTAGGGVGPPGTSIWAIYADDAEGTNQSYIQDTREFVYFYSSEVQPVLPISDVVFVRAIAIDGYSFRADIAYFASSTGFDAVYPSGLLTDGSYALATRGERQFQGTRSVFWQTGTEVEPPVSTTVADYDITEITGPAGSEGLSTRTDVAYATVLDDPISEIQRVVVEDATAISGQVNRVREVQTITPTDGRSNLREPGESPEIVTVGLPEFADFGSEQDEYVLTLTGFFRDYFYYSEPARCY